MHYFVRLQYIVTNMQDMLLNHKIWKEYHSTVVLASSDKIYSVLSVLLKKMFLLDSCHIHSLEGTSNLPVALQYLVNPINDQEWNLKSLQINMGYKQAYSALLRLFFLRHGTSRRLHILDSRRTSKNRTVFISCIHCMLTYLYFLCC